MTEREELEKIAAERMRDMPGETAAGAANKLPSIRSKRRPSDMGFFTAG